MKIKPRAKPDLVSANQLFSVNNIIPKEIVVSNGIEMIDIDWIEPNPRNFYDVSQIEHLKLTISLVGLQQNLVVYTLGQEHYRILTGGRRYKAVSELVAEGRMDLKKIPCLVVDLDKIDLPLSLEEKEQYLIDLTNQTARERSDYEKMQEVMNQVGIYQKLKESNSLPGRTRDIVADVLNVSTSQVQRYMNISNNLIEEFMDVFKLNTLPFSVANEIAKIDADGQKQLYQETDEVTLPVVKAFIKRQKAKNAPAKKGRKKASIKLPVEKIQAYLPAESTDEWEDYIIRALKFYQKEQHK